MIELTPAEAKMLRFLMLCEWDQRAPVRGRNWSPAAGPYGMEDDAVMERLVVLGLVDNRGGTGLHPRPRVTRTGIDWVRDTMLATRPELAPMIE